MSIASAETTMDRIPNHFITSRQGKDHVSYAGLLDYAHRELGLKGIRTQFIQAPSETNGHMAVMWAEVTCEHGVFTGIGDADPISVGRMIIPHILRMAETRAKARALRDAGNIGGAALEELGPDGQERDEPEPSRAAPRPAAPPTPRPLAVPMTDAQRKQIAELQRAVGTTDRVEEMTEERAQIHIDALLKVKANKDAAAAAKTESKAKRELPDADPAPQEWVSAVGKLAARCETLGGASTSIPTNVTVGQLRKIKTTLDERLAELAALEPPVRGAVRGANP